MRKFEVGKHYTPATVPSIEPLKCVSNTNCYVTFYDSEKDENIKVKKEVGAVYSGDVLEFEQCNVYGYLLRAIDD